MRILCIIPTMGPGGAERVMSYLIRHLAHQHVVTLLTFESAETQPFYSVPACVDYQKLDSLGQRPLQRLCRIAARPRILRQQVKALGPDVIISFMDTTNVTVLLACIGLEVPVIISERIDPNEHRIGSVRELLRAHAYPRARLIVVPSRRIAQYFPPSLQTKIRIIGNPIPRLAVQPGGDAGTSRKRVIAVGRYERQKGFDLLIDAFADVANAYPDWDLAIFGDGPERPNLTAQVSRLRLKERVSLAGVIPDIHLEMAKSQIFVCSSRYEGFPNALAEALGLGLAAVGYKDVSGVEELIVHERTGLIVDKVESISLAAAMEKLLGDEKRRVKLGEAGRQHVIQWTPDRIFPLWHDALMQAIGEK